MRNRAQELKTLRPNQPLKAYRAPERLGAKQRCMPPKPLPGRLVWEGLWDSRHRQETMPSHKLIIMRKMMSGGHKRNPSTEMFLLGGEDSF